MAAKKAKKAAAGGTRKRRGSGAAKRASRRKMGPPTDLLAALPEPRTAEEAEQRLVERGRSAAANGHVRRGTPLDTYHAVLLIIALILKHPKAFAERLLGPMVVKGAALLAKAFKPHAVVDESDESAAAAAVPPVVHSAYNFASARRRAIGRLAPGADGLALRHDFGISEVMSVTRPVTVLAGLKALLKGRRKHAGTMAAQYLTAADVASARTYANGLAAVVGASAGGKTGETEASRGEKVLHTALELFFDQFAAAAEAVFENDPAARFAALNLVPRRKEHRGAGSPPPGGGGGTEGEGTPTA